MPVGVYVRTEEHKRKLRERFSGEGNPMFGKHLSEEHKRKISEAVSGENHPMFGKKQPEEMKLRISKALLGKTPSEETRLKMSVAHSGERNHNFGKCGEESKNFGKKHSEEAKRKMSIAQSGENHPMFGKKHSEEAKRKMSVSRSGERNHNFGKTFSDETKQKLREVHLGKTSSEETKQKMSDSLSGEGNPMFGKKHSVETRRKISEALSGESHPMFGKTFSEERKQKISKGNLGKTQSEETKQKLREIRVGGFCIQNVTYSEQKQYCECWNSDLWKRIDESQGYKSIISDKTKENNGGRALSRHHVYWQEKACCVWDEDVQGYYAMINIGTNSKPDMHKYYINGSPNKFVLLTSEEHGLVAGSKKLGTTKLTWIKVLEDLIETKLNGKCYYTKEEYAELSLNGRFTGEGRKVGHGKLTDEQIDIVKKATGFEPDIKN